MNWLQQLKLLSILGIWTSVTHAQVPVGVIQQPVIAEFRINSIVSVPDRGQLLLGGMSDSLRGRNQFGLLLSGTALGVSARHSAVTTSVYIHDFATMDRLVQAAGRQRLQTLDPTVHPDPRVRLLFNKQEASHPKPSPQLPGEAHRNKRMSEREKALLILRNR